MRFKRFEMLIGVEALENLSKKTVCVLGVGGVGSYAIEALGRSGIGRIIIIDNDIVDITNINRQLVALSSTIGKKKVDVMKERLLDINPSLEVTALPIFLTPDNIDLIYDYKPDFVIDAIDNVEAKIANIKKCLEHKINFIVCTGTANRLDPLSFYITDLRKTEYDPLARVLRHKVKEDCIKGKIPALCSHEVPFRPNYKNLDALEKKPPASNAFTPSTAGLILASYTIKKLMEG